ncbi:hypothetical protein PV10_06963 [Exophiala mesophila]|uniref:Actin-like ATPase domain-containing protein n=1 Tax=Exophiala mesophila TaxID=212818 RepID=A0A0D1Z6Q9_EXOME|nr:uncharacterized protein PV10_06963 [Exophiala mesophila]KIV89574.1 hypothetical protein PV10_06963 [Exophiala mesophila]
MTPPGRRKTSLLSLLPLLILLFLTTGTHAASAVLGIDLGTEYFKAAIAKPGSPIDIVLSKDSKRREAATLAFKPSRAQNNDPDAFPERLYGGDAVALAARFPSDVYPNLKTLLGLDASSSLVQGYSARYPGLSIKTIPRAGADAVGGTVGFKSKSFSSNKDSDSQVFMVEELLAMEFKNVRANAEAAVVQGTFVTDVVITVPSFYTAEERRAVELAADLAGLRVLGLVSDGLAVGLNYATHRTFDSVSDGAKPEHHLVYDVGAGSATATVLKFQGRTIKGPAKRNQTIQEVIVLGTGYDRTLGGDSLNDLIVDDMVNQFLESPKIQKLGLGAATIKSHGKTAARLWKDAERMRQLLSANAVASASFEGLYDDEINFKYSLTREKFEELAASHANRIEPPILAALDAAGLGLNDLDSIILHGGLVRTPFVQKELEKIVGDAAKLKSNVNADEAAAMGAGFKAAALSPSFRVKDIRDTDISGSPITLKWSSEGKERSQKLFTSSSHIGSEKQVPVKALDDLTLSFHQLVGEEEVGILDVAATNLTKSVAQLKDKYGCGAANITTVFNIRLSTVNGIPEVISGAVSCQTDGGKAGGVIDNVKGLFGFGAKKEDEQKVLEDTETEDLPLTPLPVSDPTSSGSTVTPSTSKSSGQSDSSSTASSKASQAAKPTSSTISIPLALRATTVGLNAPPSASLSKLRGRLDQFDVSDRNSALLAEALNTLEAFTYRARDYLDDVSFISASSEKTRNEIEALISETSDWLYGEGSDAKIGEFKARLKALKALVDPVLKRTDEANKRPKAVKELQAKLETLSGMAKNVKERIEQAAESAASISSSLAEAASSSSSSTTVSSDPASEDDLEDDPYRTSSASEPKETAPVIMPVEYSEEDLKSLTNKYEKVKSWLEEKLAAQEKLGPYDDPVVLTSDLEAKGDEVQRVSADMAMKAIRMKQQNSQKLKASAKKVKSSKTKKSKSSTSTGSETTTSSVESSATTSSTTTTTQVRDEL